MNNNNLGPASGWRLLTPPVQLFRISGGIRVVVDKDCRSQVIGIRAGTKLHPKLSGQFIGEHFFDYTNLRALARSKCCDQSELNDPISDSLVLRATAPNGQCLAHSQQYYWSGVANVLHELGLIFENGLVRRMLTQIRICLRRFEKLHTAYAEFLQTLEQRPPRNRHVVQNKRTANIGIEFGAFLDSLYGLRDAINALAYRMLFAERAPFQTKKYKPKILSLVSKQSEFGNLVNSSMFDEHGGDLLLARMSTYRSVALHCLGSSNPVTHDGVLFVEEMGAFGPIIRAIFPLYDDMQKLKEIEKGTALGHNLRTNDVERRRFHSLEKYEDGMDFGFDCLARLLKMAELLGDALGLESRHLILTDDDVIEAEPSR